MSKKENALFNFLESNGGGTTIEGYTVTPTLVSGQYKGTGNTQDGLTIIVLIERSEDDRTKDI